MAASDHAILHDQTHIPTKRSLLELSSHDALLAQNKLLSKQLETLTETLNKLPDQLQVNQPSHSTVLQVGGCSICGGAHESGCCIPLDDTAYDAILPKKGPVTRVISKRLQEDWAIAAEKGLRVLINLRVDF